MFKLLPLFAGLILTALTVSAGEQKSMPLEKPFFVLHIKAEHANGANIQLNGQKITTVDGPSTRIPVNHFMHDGDNQLAIVNWPDDEEKNTYHNDSIVQITLTVEDFADPKIKPKEIASLSFSGKSYNASKNPAMLNTGETKLDSANHFREDLKQGDIIISKAIYEGKDEKYDAVVRTVTIPHTKLPQWGWTSGDQLTKTKGFNIWGRTTDEEYNPVHNSVKAEFMKLFRALAAKDFDRIAPLFEERNREMDLAFYRAPGETEKVLRRAFKSTMNDPDKTLNQVNLDETYSHIQDNNILVRLVDGGHRPGIAYIWKEGGAEFYDIFMYRKNGKWIISR